MEKSTKFEAACHAKYHEFWRDFVINVMQNVIINDEILFVDMVINSQLHKQSYSRTALL